MTGMASLVEFQDFNLNLSHHSMMMSPIPEMQTLEEIMAQDVIAEPLPTPPLSPEHVCPSPTSESSHDLDSGDSMDITEALLNDMMMYEQLFVEMNEQSSSLSLEGHFLVQDCMWNSHTYQPRNTISGMYTPAASPTLSAEEDDQDEGEDDDAPTPKSSESSVAGEQTDCISPNDVLPTRVVAPKKEEQHKEGKEPLKKVKVQPVRQTRQERTRRALEREQRKSRVTRERTSSIVTRRSSANTNGNSRIQPQASSSATSESEEEIDVVTVSDYPVEKTLTRSNPRKRLSSSASAPCSRHTSPTPSQPPSKKRRHHVKHVKRLQRIKSTEDMTESDDEQRRASHNILERKRRNDLKYSFQLLREQVPELEENQRAPKVTILRKAAEFIMYIREQEERHKQEYEKEKEREAKLLKKLEHLKSMPPLVC